jgi:hypothetical protein
MSDRIAGVAELFRILSCLTDVTDLTGLVGQIAISAGSIKFMVDEVRIMQAAWLATPHVLPTTPRRH